MLGAGRKSNFNFTIFFLEIPKLVVTQDKDVDDKDSESSDSSITEDLPSTGAAAAGIGQQGAGPSGSGAGGNSANQQRCIAMVASSLLPNQAIPVDPPPMVPVATHETGGFQAAAGHRLARNTAYPSVKPNATKNRARQLEMLQRMENYIRSRSAEKSGAASTSKMQFRPSSPPPKSKQSSRVSSFACAKNPMHMYTLDLSEVVSKKIVTWDVLPESSCEGPEDTILYSLVKGRGELTVEIGK